MSIEEKARRAVHETLTAAVESGEVSGVKIAPLYPAQPCGFYCSPAAWPDWGSRPPCEHVPESHYNIDGENTGCMECEEIENAF